MKSYALALVLGGILCVPARLLGKALNFGGFAWLVTFILILLCAGLADRDFFYRGSDPG